MKIVFLNHRCAIPTPESESEPELAPNFTSLELEPELFSPNWNRSRNRNRNQNNGLELESEPEPCIMKSVSILIYTES